MTRKVVRAKAEEAVATEEIVLPKSFEIGGITVAVVEDPHLYESHGCFGMMDLDNGKLFIDSGLVGDVRGITFLHEKIHMVLNTLGKTELNEDEAFVDGVANLLWQAIKTEKY
ncbi:MAG TPA: hypothetical protein VFM18_00960 [Methanosarcina sp.]|nr:hypothetical protein [Methanosarcina sp.]